MRCDLHCPKGGSGLIVSLAAIAAAVGVAYWVIATMFVALVLVGAASVVTLIGAGVVMVRNTNKNSLSVEDFNRRQMLRAGYGSTELLSATRPRSIEVPLTVTVINELGQEVRSGQHP